MDRVLGIVLGGGRGSRLWPLTRQRAKPAIPIGGKYRLVDIPLSNCLNSGIHQIAILTQFNSVSLHRHIAKTYHLGYFQPGWVQILATQQTMDNEGWSQGSADAVRIHRSEILHSGAREVLILAGDHLYRMNYRDMVLQHRRTKAEITVGVKPVSAGEASRFGVLRMDAEGRIVDYEEKPRDERRLESLRSRDEEQRPFWASMGIFVFDLDVLRELLRARPVDFGNDVIPRAVDSKRVWGYPFDGYWRDVGTMRAFYEANMDLLGEKPLFCFHAPANPIYTRPRVLPGTRLNEVSLKRVLMCDGCHVEGAKLENTLVGVRSIIRKGSEVRDSIVMGGDFFEDDDKCVGETGGDRPLLGIGERCSIEGAIIDRNACIGHDVQIQPFPRGTNLHEALYSVCDGIVVVPKDGVVMDGMRIAPG
ncbi:MAG: NTP transferase domain-containing protein [Deltaproteobacteria bacterium]|nr:NTP transferase domain-containing protein [Deltaproteobacteria bacterium]